MVLRSVAVIGGGLAGVECALALAFAGVDVTLFEMRPSVATPVHVGGNLAELVCSNSFRSNAVDSAVGRLKTEMRLLGSVVMATADAMRVPAGKALAVDRELFSAAITRQVEEHPRIRLVRREVLSLAEPELAGFDAVVVAAGPLASDALAASLAAVTGTEYLYFYDAIAPVVDGASVNMDVAFWGARYQPEDTDYLNCPMNKEEYEAFYNALLTGERFASRDFEKETHFEGCMPIEALAERGFKTLVFGSLKPVGFTDPRSGTRPFALLQLRAENANKTMFNLVGCQTKLTYPEQKRIFRMVPGLENAEFVRLGSMHRNTFVNAPKVLADDCSLLGFAPNASPNASPDASPDAASDIQPDSAQTSPHGTRRIYLAGQIAGVEGYVESAAMGLWIGRYLAAKAQGKTLLPPPRESALGALLGHLRTPVKRFQPSNVQFGLMPELGVRAGKANRKALYVSRAQSAFAAWAKEQGITQAELAVEQPGADYL
ncbi:methylenetetrahydrofolate--tRNA-(uracil(54)-C(5))-methyltransferase (FADH(2)-oxidizing) TrmFO [Desulfovibrio sp. OttesenSCG-928-G15]|nr:methylenetetrahydrofolate--tRNA-(uracil(54)-C(5))-methyltransferase (FADH(2)-oxidizing) TrmFO [Desulfovibrio sp. OttesenSCG-928-G15]